VKPLVYVAGPYSKPDPVVNTRNAIVAGLDLYDTGAITPLIPHLTMLAHLIRPEDIDFWYRLDLEQLEHCDAVYRLPGESTGVEVEVAQARLLSIPVFESALGLVRWAEEEWVPPHITFDLREDS
jgi:hypothetical protein